MQNRERVIDIRGLFRAVLEKWRLILLAGILVGIAMGALKGYEQYNVYKQGQKASLVPASEAESGSKAAELKMINEIIEDKNAYYVSSIIGKINPYREGRATADIIVKTEPLVSAEQSRADEAAAAQEAEQTDEAQQADAAAGQQAQQEDAAAEQQDQQAQQEETAETAEQPAAETAAAQQMRMLNILNYYNSAVKYRISYKSAAEQLGVEEELISELVSITDTVKDDNYVTVVAIYPTEEGASVILDSVLDQLAGFEEQAAAEYGAHSLMIANKASAVVVDSSLYKWANARASEITALINTRKTLDKNLSTGSAKETVVKIGKRDVIKSAVIQGAIGLLAGIAAAVVLIAFYMIAAGKVLSGRELNRYYGLRKIACVPGRKYGSLKGLDKLASSIDAGYYNHPKRTVCLQVADTGLQAMMRRDAQIALVSDLPGEYMEKLAAEMNKLGKKDSAIRYFAVPCDQQTAESVEALYNCDAAVLVAKAEASTYKGTGDVLDSVSLLGREVVGSIVLM